MALIAKKESEGNFEKELISTGMHQAVCCGMFDLGIQSVEWQGEQKKAHKIVIFWEIDENYESGELAGKPKRISKKYTLSLSEKSNLYKDLKSWLGRDLTAEEELGFDLEIMIGKNCMINICHEAKNGKTYQNIETVNPLMRNMTTMEVLEVMTEEPKWVKELQEKAVSSQATEAQKKAIESSIKQNKEAMLKSLNKFSKGITTYHELSEEDAKAVIMDFNAQIESLGNDNDIPF